LNYVIDGYVQGNLLNKISTDTFKIQAIEVQLEQTLYELLECLVNF